MRRLLLCLLLLAAAAPATAQEPAAPHRGAHLRDRIERRFAERIQEELDLTDEQAAKLKEVAKENGGRRRELRLRERTLHRALEEQLRDDVTADQDSVAGLTKALLDLRVEYADSWREEMGRLSFLTPVQRARLMVMRDRLLQRVHEMGEGRRGLRHRGDAH